MEKREHIIGGVSPLDHYTFNYFDGLGRTYWVSSSGPNGKWIITETHFDPLGRVWKNYNPRFDTDLTPYYFTQFTYDGLSRVTQVEIPDTPSNRFVKTTYQGLKKMVENQRGYSTAYTYDVYQRLKRVEDPFGTVTEYTYDILGNLTQVIAAKNQTEQNITTMTYDSLSKKRTMNDPDMGNWTYEYDKSGNLVLQTDAKGQRVRFIYDGLNRVTEKRYGDPTPISTVFYLYDEPTVPYSKGKLTKITYQPSGEDLREDKVLEYDLMQRVKKSEKKIGSQSATFVKGYDSAGRVISLRYPAGASSYKTYGYGYDVAGNLLYAKEKQTGRNLVNYSDFTSLGQHKMATFPKPNNVSVKTTYAYIPQTGRLDTLLTQRLVNGQLIDPVNDTYQNLNYGYDEKGNIATVVDTKNGITHSYTYDHLDRLLTAIGAGNNPYNETYTYDRIGNITFKTGVGSYTYNYGSKPHAVQTAGPFTFTYDANGNMTSRTGGGETITISSQNWNYDNKPTQIQKGTATITFTYDGNGQRVKKVSPNQTVYYFGELYEKRNEVGIIHVFANNQRIASVRSDGTTQFYHTNHLGSASVITDSNGNRKEQIEYYPFGTYRAVGDPNGTYDFDPDFPDVYYTYTGQEDDDDLGLYNFRARLYDPLLGRFISPDRLVPDPSNPQSLNRFTYCLNNPLIYTDPSGEFFAEIFAAIVSVVTSKAFLTATAYIAGGAALGAATSAATGGNIWQGALTGAISGAIFFGAGEIIGMAANMGQLATVAERVAVHAVAGMFAGGINSAITGGNIGLGILTGGISGGLGMAVGNLNFIPKDFTSKLLARSLAGGIAGGIAAEIFGGKFGEGFALGASTAAAGFLFNEYIHKMMYPTEPKTFPWLKQKPYPGQLAKDALLPGAVIVEGGIALGAGVALAPEITALGLKYGTIYVLGNPNTYQFIVDFALGIAPTSPSGLGGYTGIATKTYVISPLWNYLQKCH